MADAKKQYKKKTNKVTKIDSFTKEDVIQAIKGSGGVMTTIANKLGVARSTAERLIDMFEETKLAFDDEEKSMNDMAKNCILSAIQKGDVASGKWWLSKKNKAEGFGDEPMNVTVQNNAPSQIDIIGENLDKLSEESRNAYFKICEELNVTDSE